MLKNYFVFGTLFDEKILVALLGYVPKNSEAVIKGYSVFRGSGLDLSSDMKLDIGEKHELSTFKFLFAKKSGNTDDNIKGKVLEINADDEKLFDLWERYPKWYGKEKVKAEDNSGNIIEANVYVINDQEGILLPRFERIQGDIQTYIDGAKRLRKRLNLKPIE